MAETGVGVRKGRGKRRKKKLKKNLNRGQEIGEGRFVYKGWKNVLTFSHAVFFELTNR